MHLLSLPLPCSGKVSLQMAWAELEGARGRRRNLTSAPGQPHFYLSNFFCLQMMLEKGRGEGGEEVPLRTTRVTHGTGRKVWGWEGDGHFCGMRC